ncbi:MAG: NAD(P)H-hydrate dehydratase [Flavisolibacter sp.]
MVAQILNSEEIKAWDQYTIQHEPVSSIDLMQRAATRCFQWISKQNWQERQFHIFCGKGNNGGDGLAIAKLLFDAGYKIAIHILEFGKPGSDDFQINLQRLHELPVDIHFIQNGESFPSLISSDIIIDALLGSGLNKPLSGLAAQLVNHINNASVTVVSIDLPSGLFIDASSKGNSVIKATHVLTFECYKPALLVQENAPFIGEVQVLNIGLHPDYLKINQFHRQLIDEGLIKSIFQPRNAFAHKGSYGHALMIAGSYGKMGAATLATKACLHTGAGLTTIYAPKCGYNILQIATPEAMVLTDENENCLSSLPGEIEKYSAVGIGPGIGTKDETQKMLSFITRRYHKPLVIDADGLNCLSLKKELLEQLPPYSVLTPHPKEFDRLFGDHQDDFERIKTAKKKATELNVVILLKGHHTLIATPEGDLFFNTTGNAGMAKGGSGDVLTGMITAFAAQGYQPSHAAVLGVYLHGYAGDLAAKALSQEAMVATDLITFLSQAFLKLY